MPYVEEFWRDGFVVLRALIGRDDVARWRRRALEPDANIYDPLSDPVLREMVLHPAIIRAAREILGADPRYMANGTAVVGTDAGSGFHKDSCDRHDPKGPDWTAERHPVLQFGIYTQAHGPEPGGLSLRRGSHMHADDTTGEVVTPSVRPGDVIVWTSRTTHSGNTDHFRLTETRVTPNGLVWKFFQRVPVARFLLHKHPLKRVVFILAYGSDHPIAERHMRYLASRKDVTDAWRASQWGPEAYQLAVERGLKLPTKPELLAMAWEKPNVQHVPLPY